MVGDLGFEPRSSSSQSWWVAVTPVSVEMARATRIELAFIGRQPIAITRWLRPHELVPRVGLSPTSFVLRARPDYPVTEAYWYAPTESDRVLPVIGWRLYH